MLYSSDAPDGPVITMVPVLSMQVGCTVTLAAGGAGGAGRLFTLTGVAPEIQPVTLFWAVILYEPGAIPVKVVPLW